MCSVIDSILVAICDACQNREAGVDRCSVEVCSTCSFRRWAFFIRGKQLKHVALRVWDQHMSSVGLASLSGYAGACPSSSYPALPVRVTVYRTTFGVPIMFSHRHRVCELLRRCCISVAWLRCPTVKADSVRECALLRRVGDGADASNCFYLDWPGPLRLRLIFWFGHAWRIQCSTFRLPF